MVAATQPAKQTGRIEVVENEWTALGDIRIADADIAYLSQLRRRWTGIKFRDGDSGREVCFSGLCGLIKLPSGSVLYIRPKAPLAVWNMLVWLTRCPELLARYAEVALGDFPLPLIELLSELASQLLRQGLLQRYLTRREVLTKLRGRLDVQGELRQIVRGHHHRIACEYDEATFDCFENQALCRAARVALKIVGDLLPHALHTTHHRLSRIWREMRGMGISDEPLDLCLFDSLTYTRLNQHYRPALAIAEMLLRYAAVEEAPEYFGRRRAVRAFLLDTAKLFEEAVASGLAWALSHDGVQFRLETQKETSLFYAVEQQAARARGLYRVRPDMILTQRGRVIAVLDTKYKPLKPPDQVDEDAEDAVGAIERSEESISPAETSAGEVATPLQVPARDDVYQMLAYCIALGTDKAVLIYPAQEPDNPPVRVVGGARTKGTGLFSRLNLWWIQINCGTPPKPGELPLAHQWRELAAVVLALCGSP